ncbi:MAG TPA: hypothetical protein VEC99_10615 [Clostridia bacterium]|nr:hypothetical protein [Clostridia bacterium]
MSVPQLVSMGLKLLTLVIEWALARRLLDAGAKAELAGQLLATTEKVADAKIIAEWIARQPDDVVVDLLLRNYRRG